MFNNKNDEDKPQAVILRKQIKESKSKDDKIDPKKDFIISFNNVYIEIKKGERISVPAMFLENLKTEGVI